MVDPAFEELVLVESYPSEIEASVIRNRLDAEGIDTFLADSEMIGLEWPIYQAIGGVKIFTQEHDAERAKRFIVEWRADAKEVEGIPEDATRRVLKVSLISVLMPPLALYALPMSFMHLERWPVLSSDDRRKASGALALSVFALIYLLMILFLIIR